jgi:hypothetical protein
LRERFLIQLFFEFVEFLFASRFNFLGALGELFLIECADLIFEILLGERASFDFALQVAQQLMAFFGVLEKF